jgi:hypothetical protein
MLIFHILASLLQREVLISESGFELSPNVFSCRLMGEEEKEGRKLLAWVQPEGDDRHPKSVEILSP